ncbi:MAG: hypothetical protein MJE68_13780 [Proteobacteria bacterium]|nr:hypothetical protein [Pseudomonadota bacterium]
MLSITPSSVHRHFETLRDASDLAAWITDAEDVFNSEPVRDTGVVDRIRLASCLRIIETLPHRRYTNFRTAGSYRCRDRLDAKLRHRENMPVSPGAVLQ